MNIDLSLMRQYVSGQLDETTVSMLADANNAFDLTDEEVEDVMREGAELGMPLILQAEIMGDECDAMTEATITAFNELSSYFVGQGIMESAIPTNPKINVVRLNKAAIMKKLKTMYTLLLARRAGSKEFKKYKLACGIKKANREIMDRKYGARAEKMAKQHYNATKGGKVQATVAKAKAKSKS